MNKRIISQVKQNKNGQRRITVPKEEKSLEHNDYVEIRKVKLK